MSKKVVMKFNDKELYDLSKGPCDLEGRLSFKKTNINMISSSGKSGEIFIIILLIIPFIILGNKNFMLHKWFVCHSKQWNYHLIHKSCIKKHMVLKMILNSSNWNTINNSECLFPSHRIQRKMVQIEIQPFVLFQNKRYRTNRWQPGK